MSRTSLIIWVVSEQANKIFTAWTILALLISSRLDWNPLVVAVAKLYVQLLSSVDDSSKLSVPSGPRRSYEKVLGNYAMKASQRLSMEVKYGKIGRFIH